MSVLFVFYLPELTSRQIWRQKKLQCSKESEELGANVLREGGGLKRDASSCFRSWKRARLQEKDKDTGPLQYAAMLTPVFVKAGVIRCKCRILLACT